ncbi:MAG TPA: hypothetical protein VM492_07775 [Sumerlaeia bacterium]|nr:hypothetical protein [Sumerlaeia bacterium]
MTSEQQAVRTFYSKSAAFTCWATSPKRVFDDAGMSKVLDGKQINFTPQADGFGRFVTDDPEMIAYLDQRMKEVGDIFDGAEYQRRTTPPDVRIAQQERELTENNRLIEQLRRENAELQGGEKSRRK